MSQTLTLFGAPSAGTGKFAQGLQLVNGATGGTQYATPPEPGALDPLSAWTVEGWANFTDTNGSGFRIIAASVTSGGVGWWVGSGSGGKWEFYMQGVNGNNPVVTTTSVTTGTFHHFALVVNGTTVTLYVDGTSVGSGSGTFSNPSGRTSYIGGYAVNTTFFNGVLDEIRVSSVARYTGSFTAPTTAFTDDNSTVALWHFDSSPGLTVDSHSSWQASPDTIQNNTTVTVTVTGSGTSAPGGTTFSLSGGTGASIASQSFNASTQVATLSVVAGTAGGTLAISNSFDSFTASVTVTAPGPVTLPTQPGFTSATQTAVTVTATAASGGTGAVSYQWQRNIKAVSADSGWANVGGGTSLTLTDTPLGGAAAGPWYYRIIATDSAAPTPSTVTSQAVPAPLALSPIQIVRIGNSITLGLNSTTATACQVEQTTLRQMTGYRAMVTVLNRGISGTYTVDWLPSSGTGYYAAAKAAAVAQFGTPNSVTNPVYWCISLGTNDARNYGGHTPVAAGPASTPGTYAANMTAIITQAVADGFIVIIDQDPSYQINAAVGGNWDGGIDLLCAYDAINVSLANGSTIRLGDRTVRDQFNADVTNLLVASSDGVHPNQTGHNLLGACWAKGFYQAVLAPPGGRRKPW